MILVLFFVVLILFLFAKYISQRPKNFPPGPPSYPLIGGILSLPESDVHLAQEDWAHQYGHLVGVMTGPSAMLFIHGAPYVQEALKKAEFQGRPRTVDITERSYGKNLGIFFAEGRRWQVSRKFTVKFNRSFGIENMENILQLEMDELVQKLSGSSERGHVYEVKELFSELAVNTMWTILSGQRCTTQDKRIKVLLDNLSLAFRSGRPGAGAMTMLLTVIPQLRRFHTGIQTQRKGTYLLQEFFRESIRAHQATLDAANPRDFYDAFLIEAQNARNTGVDTDMWTEEDLITISLDIFSASYESVNSTICFTLLYMILYPDVQTKLQQELDQQLGSTRPTLADKQRLHYVQAVIHEVFRINTIAPIVAPHRCTEDTTFQNYFIPKDTVIFMSIWSLLHDKQIWDEPSKFKPERFLDTERKFDLKNVQLNFINFGLGK
uniref:Methyl farnesoate epoxidase n=1 Tax=Cacopsylla melanoneura TaxID=428564 RepID=A0A8D8PKC1_9HEMI